MKLLVSVSDADEARSAVLGGADIVDAKDPAAGPIGAVSALTLREIRSAAHSRPVSAALGDAVDLRDVEQAAAHAALSGATTIKVGFAGRPTPSRVRLLLEAAIRGASASRTVHEDGSACEVFAVAYADWSTTHGPSPQALVEIAAGSRASGVLIDTADKAGPGLQALMDGHVLATWVRTAHEAGLQVAVAGKLRAEDTRFVLDAGADVMGVRGAACDGGRTGRVSVDKVRRLVGLRSAVLV